MGDSADIISHFRSIRIGEFAIFDFITVFLVAQWISKKNNMDVIIVFIMLILLGIMIHELLGIKTPLNTMVLGSKQSI